MSPGGNVEITTDSGTPVLALCQGAPTEAERDKWVGQLQLPMIYTGDNGFVLVYRTPVGKAAIQPLGETDQAKAAKKARTFLAGHAVVNNTGQARQDYNQRESDNLMNIVAVVYGVALTAAISSRPSLLLHPLIAPHRIPSLALLAAGLLTAFTFYSYVLSVGGDKPYDVIWSKASSKPESIFRFFADLILASLYVHLLFAAVNVDTRPSTAPKLAGFVLAFIPVLAGAVVVRRLRGLGYSPVAMVALVAAAGLYVWARLSTATHGTDISIEVVLIVAVLVYGGVSHWYPYHLWKDKNGSGPPSD
jgi:hypothetical protein